MKPSEYRRGGQGLHIRYATAKCDLGWVLVAATDRGICAIEFADAPQALENRLRQQFPLAEQVGHAPDLSA